MNRRRRGEDMGRKHTIRVVKETLPDGKVRVTRLDARTGRVANRHETNHLQAEKDVEVVRQLYAKGGNRVDVVER